MLGKTFLPGTMIVVVLIKENIYKHRTYYSINDKSWSKSVVTIFYLINRSSAIRWDRYFTNLGIVDIDTNDVIEVIV